MLNVETKFNKRDYEVILTNAYSSIYIENLIENEMSQKAFHYSVKILLHKKFSFPKFSMQPIINMIPSSSTIPRHSDLGYLQSWLVPVKM